MAVCRARAPLLGVPTAFVLSGGGSYGAMQVGMLRALAARGVQPDLVVGASVGALNGAWFAASPDTQGVDGLTRLWRELEAHEVFPVVRGRLRPWRLGRHNHVFPLRPWPLLLGALGRRDHLVSNRAFRAFLQERLPLKRLEAGRLPLHVVATDLLDGQMVAFREGDAIPAVLASSALPGVFPPVSLNGRLLVDGGVADNTPVDHAVELGATEIYVLPAGFGRRLASAPKKALGVGAHSLGLALEQRLITAVHRTQPGVTLRVAPSPPVRVLPLDFATTSELIDTAEALTSDWLDAGAPEGEEAVTGEPGTS